MTDEESMKYLYAGIAQSIVAISKTYEHSCYFKKLCGDCPCQPFCKHIATKSGDWTENTTALLTKHFSTANYHKFKQDYPELLI